MQVPLQLKIFLFAPFSILSFFSRLIRLPFYFNPSLFVLSDLISFISSWFGRWNLHSSVAPSVETIFGLLFARSLVHKIKIVALKKQWQKFNYVRPRAFLVSNRGLLRTMKLQWHSKKKGKREKKEPQRALRPITAPLQLLSLQHYMIRDRGVYVGESKQIVAFCCALRCLIESNTRSFCTRNCAQ